MKRTKNNQILYRIFVELLSLIVCFNLCVPVRALGPGDVPGGGDYSDNDGADTDTIDIPDVEVPLTEIPDTTVPETPAEEIDVDDPPVPLAEAPEEELVLDEPDVPLADVPHTGDCAQWTTLSLLSCGGLLWMLLNEKKRKAE